MKTAYVKHPVTPDQKAKIRAEGFIIVDAKFAPLGAEIYGSTPLFDEAPKKRGRPKKKDD